MPTKSAPQVHKAQSLEPSYSKQEIELIKDTVCKGASDEEFKVFLHACRHTKLDPLMKQIYSVPRWDNQLKRQTRTVQVSIHGKRLIADRTGRYMPGPKPQYTYDADGRLQSCTAYVKRMDSNREWQTIEGHVLYKECVQLTKEGRPSGLWANKEHRMLSKCAESLALDLAFPAEMSSTYTHEEMGDMELVEPPKTLEPEQIDHLEQLIALVPDMRQRILTAFNVHSLNSIKAEQYNNIKSRLEQIIDQRKAEGKLQQPLENIEDEDAEEVD